MTRTTDEGLRTARATLTERDGSALFIDSPTRDRMIREIDAEIALRAAQRDNS